MQRRSSFRIGAIRGFEVRVDASWFILFFLILWSLSAGTFPAVSPALHATTYLAMGLVGTLLFVASILLHELAHSVVAQARGIGIHGITLFVFGGLAHTQEEPHTPEDELAIAGVGPVVSLGLGALLLAVAALGRAQAWSPAVHEVAQYLGFINVLLAVFNLLPGYPLDGGRVFRAIVWKRTGDRVRATRWAAAGGRWVGLALIVLGIAEAVLLGAVVGGLWLALIGTFLRGAARMAGSPRALEPLADVRASDVMARDTPVVDAHMSLRDLARRFAEQSSAVAAVRGRLTAFPVRDGGRIVGTLALSRLERTPRDDWSATAVGQVMTRLDRHAVVGPDTDMRVVLDKLGTAEDGQLLVMDDDRVVGTISRADLAPLAVRTPAGPRPSSRVRG
ncbi:MAG: site-2 protease family protein [Gemmatimonadales bacterium]